MRTCVLGFLFLAGCGPGMILMVNPQSGERVECRGDGGAFVTRSYAAAHLVAARGAEDCAKQYEQIGFQRVVAK